VDYSRGGGLVGEDAIELWVGVGTEAEFSSGDGMNLRAKETIGRMKDWPKLPVSLLSMTSTSLMGSQSDSFVSGIPAELIRGAAKEIVTPGKRYRVAASHRLTAPDQVGFSGDIPATESTTSWSGGVPFSDGSMFLRIVVVP
jgi:hypothetical protein